MKTYLSFKQKMLAGFGIAVIIAASLVVTNWTVTRNAAETSRGIARTHEMLNSLSRVKSDGLNIELTTQNFRLTGDASLVAERDASIAAREITLQRIKALAADIAPQQERYRLLRAVVDERLAISREVARIRSTEGAEAAGRFVATAMLGATRARMYGLLHEMEAEESRLLAIRISNDLRANQRVVLANVAAAALLGGLLFATYLVIRRQSRETAINQQALAETEEQLAITLRSIGDAVLATDVAGRIIRMNPLAERLTGWTLEEARGRQADEVFCIINEHTREPAATAVGSVLATGKVAGSSVQATLIARGGRETPVADTAAPIHDRAGRVTGVVLVFRDESVARLARNTIHGQNELLERRVAERTDELRISQDHLLGVISNVPAMIAFVDSEERYVYANRQYSERFGPREITGCTVREILGEERYALASPLIAAALAGVASSDDWQPFPGVWQVINYVPKFDDRRAVVGYYVLGADITERKHSEHQIQSLNEQLQQHVHDLEHVSRALRTLSAGNRCMLHAADEADLLDSMCRAIVAAGGYRMACVWYTPRVSGGFLEPVAQSGHPGGMSALHRIKDQGGGDPEASTAVAQTVRIGEPCVMRKLEDQVAYAPWLEETAIFGACVATPLRVAGQVVGALAIYSARDDDFSSDEVALLAESSDDLAFGIATFRARGEQEKGQQDMHRLTHYDDVTGLPNETQFAQIVAAAIDAASAGGPGFAILQANVERLREINEVLGFSHGDALLRMFGARLRTVIPAAAAVSRLRGDEFAILLPDSRAAQAVALARQLDSALADPFPIADIPIEVSARVGISVYPEHGVTVHDLFRHMDIAVNHARMHGLRHTVFEPAYSHGQASRLTMVGELRNAIDAGHLMLYLQPKVDMRSGKVCGAEGLVRWNHATRGMISPVEFIGLAEQTTLIKPLTNWVIDAAVQLSMAWKSQGYALPIAINLSASSLRDDALLEKIRGMRTMLDTVPGMLEMELTESMLMEDNEHTLQVLHGLRAENIELYIDDFGTGYSSLRYLQKMPVAYIKIDQSFVERMLDNEGSAAIVRSTIDLAHDLGRKVVAEGVETQEHWDRLAAYGCDIAQGYFIARPMAPQAFLRWIDDFASRPRHDHRGLAVTGNSTSAGH